MCLPFKNIFNYCYNNLCCCFHNELSNEDIQYKRLQMLPFAWKYKITPIEQMKQNVNKTEVLASKSEELASSCKKFRDLTKELCK